MTTTCSGLAMVKHDFLFFMSETLAKAVVYTSMIQSVFKYDIFLSLMAYTMMLVTRRRGGTLQILEIDKHISILGVGR
jgi:hypothetical protein